MIPQTELIPFDISKYELVFETEGLPAALTVLHRDINAFEEMCFEGSSDDMAKKKAEVESIRLYCRSMWNRQLRPKA